MVSAYTDGPWFILHPIAVLGKSKAQEQGSTGFEIQERIPWERHQAVLFLNWDAYGLNLQQIWELSCF